ncbi:MAG TPA: tetraacyldisaccharide 4'-kinase, partial [Candidatus Polarisedimenticolia bacterium]|nr:tetraacyldisaccharide 4'-kinase [Candidatus Polarisedimenticolia bacterium]
VPLFHAVSRPAALLAPAAGEELPLETLRGETVVCVAGIARPSRFFQAAAAAGARVAAALPFPDHHPYSAADLSAVAERAGREKGAIVLITEKDLARLPREAAARLPRLRALLMETLVEEGPAFTALLERAAS